MPIGMTRSQINQLHLMVNQQSSQPQVEINVLTPSNKKNSVLKQGHTISQQFTVGVD